MAFNPVDEFTVARWLFDSRNGFGLGSSTSYPAITPVDKVYPSPSDPDKPFVDVVGGAELSLLDTLYAASNSKSWRQGVPCLFGKRGFAMTGGPNSKDRDIIFGSMPNVGAGGAPWNFSQWFLPYTLGSGLASLFAIDYRSSNSGDPSTDGLGTEPYSAPFVSARIGIGENADGRWQVDWTTGGTRTNIVIGPTLPADGEVGIGVMRPRVYNLVGWSWASGVLYLWLNGVLVHQVSIGAIDFNGNAGFIHWGGTLFKGANPEHFNGVLGPAQFDSTNRDADWWADYYMSAATSSGGAPPVVTF